jgi:hypothetical protein
MTRKYYSALAVSAVAIGTVVLTATEASAAHQDPQPRPTSQPVPAWPDEGSGYPGSGHTTPEYNYPNYDRKLEVAPTKAAPAKTTAQSTSNGNGVEFLQSGASALGGAAVALSGVWLYRRRQLPTA